MQVSHSSNLHPKMRGSKLFIPNTIKAHIIPPMEFISLEEYNNIRQKDPVTMYYVTDNKGRTSVFRGENYEPSFYNSPPRYTMGNSANVGEYDVYQTIIRNGITLTLTIGTFSNPQDALCAMESYNKVGSHTPMAVHIHQALLSYVTGDSPMVDVILLLIGSTGYKDDPRYQELISTIRTKFHGMGNELYYKKNMKHDIELLRIGPNHLFELYARIYDVFIENDFFQDKSYHLNDTSAITFGKVIQNIIDTCLYSNGNLM